MAHRKHKRGQVHEEHENHERWLVSYADMITVLMALFIVMFAISQVDAGKFNELKTGLARTFGNPAPVFGGGAGPMQDDGRFNAPLDLAGGISGPDGPAGPQLPAQDPAQRAAVAAAERAKAQRNARAAAQEVDNLNDIQDQILAALARQGLQDSVRFHIDERGLVVTIVTSSVVFEGDRADLLQAGRKIINAVAPALKPLPNQIQVDGHTNQLRVPTIIYPSAWELSTARATTVVRHLIDQGVPARRLSAAGYAGHRPLYPPDDPRAVALNRRVEIIVLSTQPAEVRALLPAASGHAATLD